MFLTSLVPDPNNPSEDRLQYTASDIRWGCLGLGTRLVSDSLGWPRPFLRRLVGRVKGEGREEEGSGDSEQDAVAKWNVIGNNLP